jgi:hypothetical protein
MAGNLTCLNKRTLFGQIKKTRPFDVFKDYIFQSVTKVYFFHQKGSLLADKRFSKKSKWCDDLKTCHKRQFSKQRNLRGCIVLSHVGCACLVAKPCRTWGRFSNIRQLCSFCLVALPQVGWTPCPWLAFRLAVLSGIRKNNIFEIFGVTIQILPNLRNYEMNIKYL